MTNPVQPTITQRKVEGLICVTLEVHLWSGKKRLRKEALIAKNPEFEKLPPETLATLGSIKICDTDDLHPFQNLKRRAEKLLELNGLPVLGTWGIPEAKLEKVFAEMVKIKNEFDTLKADFEKRFNAAIEEWQNHESNREWANLISDIPSPEHVAGRMSFGFHLCRVNAPSEDEHSAMNALYAKQMTGLKGKLFADAAREADILMTRFLTQKATSGVVSQRESISWKTLRPLVRIGEKFRSFAFLDSTCEPLAEMIEHMLKLLPQNGPIDGVHLVHVWSLSRTLANPADAMAVAQFAAQVQSPADAFQHILASKQPVQVQSTTPVQPAQAGANEPAEVESVETVAIQVPVGVNPLGSTQDGNADVSTQPPVVEQAPQRTPVFEALF
jgi:hypothetical protein